MYHSRAQAATEFMIILAIITIIFIIIVGITQQTQRSVESQNTREQAREFVSQLSHNARLVYTQGVGAKTRITVTLPAHVAALTMSNQSIALTYAYGGSNTSVYETLPFSVNGSLPNLFSGTFVLDIEMKENGVQIQVAS